MHELARDWLEQHHPMMKTSQAPGYRGTRAGEITVGESTDACLHRGVNYCWRFV